MNNIFTTNQEENVRLHEGTIQGGTIQEGALQEEIQHEETLLDIINDMLDAYMEECIKHFLITRSRSMKDDGRYFYTKEELETFKIGYTAKGGDLEKLHIGPVYCNDGSFLCYEVCRKIYYNAETLYAKKQLYDENGNRKQIFFS